MNPLAVSIARGYPVTSEYVAWLLEVFTEEETRRLLDFYCAVGWLAPLDFLRERALAERGL